MVPIQCNAVQCSQCSGHIGNVQRMKREVKHEELGREVCVYDAQVG